MSTDEHGRAEDGQPQPIDPTPLDVRHLVDRPSAPDEPPARVLLRLGHLIDEAVETAKDELRKEIAAAMDAHMAQCHALTPEPIDEPPVRAVANVTHYVHRVAKEAVHKHELAYHPRIVFGRSARTELRILDALARCEEPVSVNQLADAVGDNPHMIYMALRRMPQVQRIKQGARVLYKLAPAPALGDQQCGPGSA